MHRIALVRRENKPVTEWQTFFEKNGFTIDQKNPTLVFSIGGDGTFLVAERKYPSVPKVLLRESTICNKCYNGTPEELIAKIKNNQYTIQEFAKITTAHNGTTLDATNDISIRNHYPTNALRFELHGTDIQPNTTPHIGDGIVIATTFGATGYFYSITKQTFTSGFGIAWNNHRTHLPPLLLPELNLTFTLTRGEGILTLDNDPAIHTIQEGGTLSIKTSTAKTRVLIPA